MHEISKVWSRLGVALLAGTTLSTPLAAEPSSPNAASSEVHAPHPAPAPAAAIQLAQRGGEGGGEGGERGAANPANNDVAFLTTIGLVRGHLLVGSELYKVGAKDMAASHMKHPEDELYAQLQPAFARRKTKGFDAALSRLSGLVERGAPEAEVAAAYDALEKEIDRVQSVLRAMPLKGRLLAIANLVRVAADEYAVGVKDGQVVNAHEYQDAYGFVTVARRMLSGIHASERVRNAKAVKAIEEHLDAIKPAWPNIVPPPRVESAASQIAGAAARIELAALSVN